MALGGKCTGMLFHGAYPPKKSEPSHVSQSKESDGTTCTVLNMFCFLGPVPSMCWQSPDSLSYHVGMGTVD